MSIICDECTADIREKHDNRVICSACYGGAVSSRDCLQNALTQLQDKYNKLENAFYKLVKKANALQVKLNSIKNKRKH